MKLIFGWLGIISACILIAGLSGMFTPGNYSVPEPTPAVFAACLGLVMLVYRRDALGNNSAPLLLPLYKILLAAGSVGFVAWAINNHPYAAIFAPEWRLWELLWFSLLIMIPVLGNISNYHRSTKIIPQRLVSFLLVTAAGIYSLVALRQSFNAPLAGTTYAPYQTMLIVSTIAIVVIALSSIRKILSSGILSNVISYILVNLLGLILIGGLFGPFWAAIFAIPILSIGLLLFLLARIVFKAGKGISSGITNALKSN